MRGSRNFMVTSPPPQTVDKKLRVTKGSIAAFLSWCKRPERQQRNVQYKTSKWGSKVLSKSQNIVQLHHGAAVLFLSSKHCGFRVSNTQAIRGQQLFWSCTQQKCLRNEAAVSLVNTSYATDSFTYDRSCYTGEHFVFASLLPYLVTKLCSFSFFPFGAHTLKRIADLLLSSLHSINRFRMWAQFVIKSQICQVSWATFERCP